MPKISPINTLNNKINYVKKTMKNSLKNKENLTVNLSGEGLGYYKVGDRVVKQIFPR